MSLSRHGWVHVYPAVQHQARVTSMHHSCLGGTSRKLTFFVCLLGADFSQILVCWVSPWCCNVWHVENAELMRVCCTLPCAGMSSDYDMFTDLERLPAPILKQSIATLSLLSIQPQPFRC